MYICNLTAKYLKVSDIYIHIPIVKGLSTLLLKIHVFKELYFQELRILCAFL